MIKQTLYKRNANGTVNQWSIIIECDGYFTEFGVMDGKLQASDKVYTEPKNVGKKNETSVQQQAILEATSLYNKKIKSENYKERIQDIDELSFNPPMLAKEYKKYSKDIKYTQPKLDGIRCNISISGAVSRKNKSFYTVDHIISSLKEVLENNPSLHIDGELYNHVLHDDFNSIVSLVKKEHISNEDKTKIESLLEYHIYDIWDDNNPDLTFSERNKIINKLFNDLSYIRIVPTFQVSSKDEVDSYREKFETMGYEGSILRLDVPYEHKRSKALLKYKVFDDSEFQIIDICEGRIKGQAEYAVVQLKDSTCRATISMSDDKCQKLLINKDKYIGELATVKYFGFTNDGKLRFPVLKSIRNYE